MIRKFLIFIFSIVLSVLVGAWVLQALHIYDVVTALKLAGNVKLYAEYALGYGPVLCGLIIGMIATFRKSISIIAFIPLFAATVGYVYYFLKIAGLFTA